MAKLEVSDLRKVYEKNTAVKDISFKVPKGLIFGIIGPNGAGKTTTLKMISGLLEPTSGEIRVDGSTRGDRFPYKIGFLPEESNLYDNMTSISYLKFFADLYEVEEGTAEDRIYKYLDDLRLDQKDIKIGNMSKGMKRKVAIARSLINDPEILIFDEPASGLDPVSTNYILNYIRDLKESGKTIILSAHNLFHIETICEEAMMLKNGEVIFSGTIGEIKKEFGDIKYQIYSKTLLKNYNPSKDGKLWKYEVRDMKEMKEIENSIEDNGGEVKDIRTKGISLEEIFLERMN